nr:DUF87 domain-containing protein [Candidatus Njordarchaeum guaymaensis]
MRGAGWNMLLEYVLYQFLTVLLILSVIICFVIVIGLLFQSTRSVMFSFLRWMLHGLGVLLPYAFSAGLGAVAGVFSYDVLDSSSVTMRWVLGVVLFLVSTYSLLSLVFQRIKCWLPPVKFALLSSSLVIVLDFGVGSLVTDDFFRGLVAWVSSALIAWLLLYERDTLRGLTTFSDIGKDRKHSPSSSKAHSLNYESSGGLEPLSAASEDCSSSHVFREIDDEGDQVVGSVEVVGVPESYFSGKVVTQGYGDASAGGGEDVALRFRAFVISLVESGNVVGFKQVFNDGRGRFFIQCREDGALKLRRVLQDIDAALHSWFPDFETKIHYDSVSCFLHGGRHACGWVANAPAPSRNPMKHVAELFIQRKLTGSVTIIAEASTSRMSSLSRKLRYRRLSAKARKQDQQDPLLSVANRTVISNQPSYGAETELKYLVSELQRLDSKLQAKCWITIACERSTYGEAETDLDLVLRTFVSAYSFEEKHHELHWGKFPRRKAEVVHRLTSRLVPRGKSTVLLPSDLALYFWLPELDSVTRVKRKGGFLAPTREEISVGEISLGRVLRHGSPTEEEVRLSVGDMLRHCTVIGSSGSGKTWTTMNMLMALHKCGVPFLVLDPVKKEYRSLIHAVPGLRVFTVGDETAAPLRFNILEVPEGVKPQKHIDMVYAALCASIVMYAPAPYVLQIALNETFTKSGWNLLEGRRGKKVTLRELKETVKKIVVRAGYDTEARNNIAAALSTRFESLSQGGKGAALCSKLSMSPKELITHSTVVEFSEMGAEEDRAIVILMILLSIYEYLQTLGPTPKPRCAIVVEEAGALFSRVEGKGGLDYDSKEARRKAIEVISRITAEIRALGAIIIFVNQSAVNLPLEVTQNTSTKIIHTLADDEDAEKAARMLGLNEEQKRALVSLDVGRPVVKTPRVSHPFQVEVTPVTVHQVNPTEFVTDHEVRSYMKKTFYDARPEYLKTSVGSATTVTASPAATFSVTDLGMLAESISAREEFRENYSGTVSRARRAGSVGPLVKLLVAEASRYMRKPDEVRALALKIFEKASLRYNQNADPIARKVLLTLIERELIKRQLMSQRVGL